MDPRTLIWAIIIILYLLFRSRYRSKKSNQQNPSNPNNPSTPAPPQTKRRTLEDVFRDVETRTKPFGDRGTPRQKPPPQKIQKPAPRPLQAKQPPSSPSVQQTEVAGSEISKSQIGSTNEGITSKSSYSFSLKDAMIASIILSRRNFNEVPQEEVSGSIFNRP